MKNKKISIGCASAFWGDSSVAAKQLVKNGDIDYLVFDYLAEITMSILAGAKMKNPELGYANDFIDHIFPIIKNIKDNKIKVISNAGGLNLEACRSAILKIANDQNLNFKIAIVLGDDLTPIESELKKLDIKNIDNNAIMPNKFLSINAYLGANEIKKALEEGADIVITGRCVDTAVVLGPLMYEFGWEQNQYDLLASGSLAGHIIECGTQCTGGNFTDWNLVKDFDNMGFPIVDVKSNGEFIVRKPNGTGGLINRGTVAEQFLYEIGNPKEYVLPDVVCDFSNVVIENVGKDRVLVKGAKGQRPTKNYKVSATYIDGFKSVATIVIGGIDAVEKSKIVGASIIKKVSKLFLEKGFSPFSDTKISILGSDSIYRHKRNNLNPREVVLRIAVMHNSKEALISFSKEIAHASTGMTPGVMNFFGGRPKISPCIKLFSFFYPKENVTTLVNIDNKNIETTGSQISDFSISSYNNFIDKSEIESNLEFEVPLHKLAYARSGDKGDHANIGIISREPSYFEFIKKAVNQKSIKYLFNHVLKGTVEIYEVPGVFGLNLLLKNSLGGGGLSSLNVDPQGKAYAQQLLELPINVPDKIANELF